jgi:hypothetical protein
VWRQHRAAAEPTDCMCEGLGGRASPWEAAVAGGSYARSTCMPDTFVVREKRTWQVRVPAGLTLTWHSV